ncbi:MAG: hypothetical protein GWO16_08380 [Gammaproteobacteria bacterium]|nr:hypothetical protein [Gammaproteobacteria bacterium]NIV21523.1 hypothetical protein [Gammaproteobacteria bacterium]
MSSYRARGSQMGDDVAVRLAGLLQISALEVVASIRAEAVKEPEARSFWRRIQRAARDHAASVIVGLGSALLLPGIPGAAGQCILCQTGAGRPAARKHPKIKARAGARRFK